MRQQTVAVVGSGASGLAAAFRLHEAGYRVRLLERGERPGGRMSTVVRDGFSIEEGPSGLTRGHTSILGIVPDAGLSDEIVEASSLVGIADRGDDIHLLRYRKHIDVEDLSKMSVIDHLSAAEYGRRREHNKRPGRAPAGKGMVGIYPTPRWSDVLFDPTTTSSRRT